MLSACLWVRYGSQANAAASADVRPLEDEDEDESGDLHITGLSNETDSDKSDITADDDSEGDSAADDDSDK